MTGQEKQPSPAVIDGYLRLAAAILDNAYLDIVDGDNVQGVDALLWLGLSDVPVMILDCLDMGGLHPLSPIVDKNKFRKLRLRRREK